MMSCLVSSLLPLVVLAVLPLHTASIRVDDHGYLVYCPCMGRFGNQADQFLGSLRFAASLNRTLILPPWVEYHPEKTRSVQVSFDTYFKTSEINKFHRAVTMETFMKTLAPTVWPPGQRIAFCYNARTPGKKKNDCNAKEGNPFGPFWDTFNIEFDKSEFFSPLFYETGNAHEMKRWVEKYPPSEFPVLAFAGPPAAFPVKEMDVQLHKYIRWSNKYEKLASNFIKEFIPEKPFLGIHLRTGSDFERACELIDDTPNLFGAAQCIGYRGNKGRPTRDTCFPSDKTIVREVKAVVKNFKIKTVFVATDKRDLIDEMQKAMKKIKFVKQRDRSNPHLDLAVLGRADHFIGNCISTFTAFVKRERDVRGLPSSFWAFESTAKPNHQEL